MKDTFTKVKMVAFSSMTISVGIGAILISWVSFFATEYLGLSVKVVGILFMVSKIFDGFTDILAGTIIDKVDSKLGKGRPYDLAMIGYWLSVIFMFVVPIMSINLTYAWVFVMYTLCHSVFQTLLSCANTVYMANVIDRPDQTLLVNAITGIFSMVASTVGGVAIPQLAANYGNSREGWGKIAILIAIPALFVGMIRFFVVKEKTNRNTETSNVTIKDTLSIIISNKYVTLIALVILISNIGYHSINGVTSYYCNYVLGDVGTASVMSLTMLSTVISLTLTPIMAKKIGLAKFIRVLTIIAVIACVARLFAPTNLTLLFVTGFLITPGFLTSWLYLSSFLIDCIDYGEWKTGARREGSITCLPSFCSKVGVAFGAGLVGLLMGISGYEGALTVQPDSAIKMLILMFSVIPAVFGIIQYIILRFYDLDEKLPGIREELSKRKQV